MLVASGNVVHNLRTARWHGENSRVYPWAESFNNYVKANLQWQGWTSNTRWLTTWHTKGLALQPDGGAFPAATVCPGGRDGVEAMTIPVDGIEMGSLSMLSVLVGA